MRAEDQQAVARPAGSAATQAEDRQATERDPSAPTSRLRHPVGREASAASRTGAARTGHRRRTSCPEYDGRHAFHLRALSISTRCTGLVPVGTHPARTMEK